LIIIHCFI